jgi:hypothetical protein
LYILYAEVWRATHAAAHDLGDEFDALADLVADAFDDGAQRLGTWPAAHRE